MQMAKWIIAALALFLTACGDQAENNSVVDQNLATNYGWGYGYDERDPETGLRVRYDTATTSWRPALSELVARYKAVMECTGLTSNGPLVVITANLPAGIGGHHYADTGTIAIIDIYGYQHEGVHYLLQQTGFPREDNNKHRSPLFDCSY